MVHDNDSGQTGPYHTGEIARESIISGSFAYVIPQVCHAVRQLALVFSGILWHNTARIIAIGILSGAKDDRNPC